MTPDDVRAQTIAAGHAARDAALAAHRDPTAALAARWPTGPGPLIHGRSSAMTKRCRELNGQACQTCRAHEAERKRLWKAARTTR